MSWDFQNFKIRYKLKTITLNPLSAMKKLLATFTMWPLECVNYYIQKFLLKEQISNKITKHSQNLLMIMYIRITDITLNSIIPVLSTLT